MNDQEIEDFIKHLLATQKHTLVEEIKKMKRRIDKNRTTEEKRYPHGYNRALRHVIALLDTHTEEYEK